MSDDPVDVVDSLDSVADYVASFGVGGRSLRVLIGLLTEASPTLDGAIRATGLSRRTVEGLFSAAGGDLERRGDAVRIRPDRRSAYRSRFACDQLGRSELPDGPQIRLGDVPGLVAEMERLISQAPRPLAALDHVPATPETAVRRALWLEGTYDLAGARVLCVGDHDLSSLALCSVNPEVAVTVVDFDERILEFVDEQARRRGLAVRCLFCDVRLGLPAGTVEWADLVLTDPPYTPEGVELFVGRGLQAIRDRDNGRVVVAYGFGERQPALGLKVQGALHDLQVVFEAILPDFNRYHGAQAVGSASDLYVCRPTSRTRSVVDRRLRDAATHIYTHGPQALEGRPRAADAGVSEIVSGIASGTDALPVSVVVTGGAAAAWQSSGMAGAVAVSLERLLADGLPAAVAGLRAGRGGRLVAVADLSATPGPWLLRVLLATNADRMAVLIPNGHPDLADESAQRGLIDAVRPKYRLRLRRSTPSAAYAVVEAERVDPSILDAASRLLRHLLDRAHGKVGNAWREGLIAVSREHSREPLTKNAARTTLARAARRPEVLDARLIDIPRHQLRELAQDVAASCG